MNLAAIATAAVDLVLPMLEDSELSFQELDEAGDTTGDPVLSFTAVVEPEEDANRGIQSGTAELTIQASPFNTASRRLDEGRWEVTIRGRARSLGEDVRAVEPDAGGDPAAYLARIAL